MPVLLLIGYSDEVDLKRLSDCKIKYRELTDDYEKQLKFITNKLEKEKIPCALVIKEGVLK